MWQVRASILQLGYSRIVENVLRESESHSVMSASLRPHGSQGLFVTPQSMEFFRPEYWSGCRSLLQGISPTQGLNPGLPHCRWILYHLSHQGRKCVGRFQFAIIPLSVILCFFQKWLNLFTCIFCLYLSSLFCLISLWKGEKFQGTSNSSVLHLPLKGTYIERKLEWIYSLGHLLRSKHFY